MRQAILKISKSSFNFEMSFQDSVQKIKIQIPNLENLPTSEWSDWGPMCHVTLSPDGPLAIYYDGELKILSQNELCLETPILAKDRLSYLVSFLVNDPEKGVSFRVYLGHDLSFSKIEIIDSESADKELSPLQ